MKLRNPLEIWRFRKERKTLESKIDDYKKRNDLNPNDEDRMMWRYLRMAYKYKYFKEYKGSVLINPPLCVQIYQTISDVEI